MRIAEIPGNEEFRLLDLATYDLQDAETEMEFDQLSVLIAQYFNCPLALVTVIDKDRQWFKGKTGTIETGNTRELSFCSHTILSNEVMVVEDATKDERFFDNPFVAGEFNIRFYAGAPIISTDGYILGTVCIYDMKPGKINASKKNALILFSKQVTKLLELRKKNILLRKRAEEMIKLKSEILARFIRNQEADLKTIAFNLHEDYAQGIAASLMILQMAKKNTQQSTTHINNAAGQLKEILVKIRTLSYSITPNVPDWIAIDQLVLEFIDNIAVSYPFKITVENTGQVMEGSGETTLCAIRIIEQWLKVLQKKKEISNVHISLVYADHFVLTIQDDGPTENPVERKKDIFESAVYDRVYAQGGSIELYGSAIEKSMLKVLLPNSKKI